jgi:hypothetical protein
VDAAVEASATPADDGGRSSSCASSVGSPPSADAGTAGPTWSSLYASYFAANTVGRCAACHNGMSKAPDAYAWLSRKGQIPGIADPNVSRLSWLCGDMPPGGTTSDARAAADLAAWAAAGAKSD